MGIDVNAGPLRYSRSRWALLGVPLTVAALVLAACGSSGSPSSSGSASAGAASSGHAVSGTINIGVVIEETGPAAFAGVPGLAGLRYGFSQMEKSGYLGKIKVNLEVQDSAGVTSTAARLASQFVQQKVNILVGPSLSSESVAVAPIAAKAGIPMVCVQCGSPGVLIAPNIFRLTALQSSYQDVTAKYLQSQGVKKVSFLYTNAVPTITDLFTTTWPSLAPKYGFTISNNVAVGLTATDFSSAAAKLVSGHPGAIGVLLTGAPNVSAVEEIRQAGFKGIIFGQQGMGAGVLAPGGSAVNGTIYAEDYNPGGTTPSAKQFESGYKAATGSLPNNFTAEGYDMAYFIGRALLAATSNTSSGIVAGMTKVTQTGFDGAVGAVKFDGHQEVVSGVLVRWADGKSTTISS
jgi:branched-chain amino acid transport system substrate-binding protein